MELLVEVVLPGSPDEVAPWVNALDAYPQWMSLVHRAVPETDQPAWTVDLRARIGPLARSKRLRMLRTMSEAGRARFERRELDGRQHGIWVMDAEWAPIDTSTVQRPETRLVVRLDYQGAQWASGLVDRVLHDGIEQAKSRLVQLISDGAWPSPTP
jgi:hypothetical protein